MEHPDQILECFSVFSHPTLPFIFITLLLLILLLLLLLSLVITVIIISMELLALCDGCLGLGLGMAGGARGWLRVGQAFGVLLLSGLSLAVPGHPTSTCDAGIKDQNTVVRVAIGQDSSVMNHLHNFLSLFTTLL